MSVLDPLPLLGRIVPSLGLSSSLVGSGVGTGLGAGLGVSFFLGGTFTLVLGFYYFYSFSFLTF